MNKRAAFITNMYYSDVGMEYVFARLREELRDRGVSLYAAQGVYGSYPMRPLACDFVVFWNKDTALARRLESTGLRLFNSAATIALCDDKEKTFAVLEGKTELPPTVVAPLVYDVSDGEDAAFLAYAEHMVGYPAVVKACVGSQGRQVFLAENRTELAELHHRLMHVPHLFQKYIRGACKGADTRVYIVGQKAVGAAERTNTTDFRSNTALGGTLHSAELTPDLRAQAETAARALRLEYGSTDFICENGKYVFIEANSAAYMQNAERLGIDLAAKYADHLTEAVYGTCG